MGWVYLDDRFPEHPKVIAAGDAAAWMFVCALGYTSRHGRTGTIPKDMVPRLTGANRPAVLARKLVDVGLWFDLGPSYEINDYQFWNSSAIQRSEKAKKAAEARWSPHAQASAEHVPDDPLSNARGSPEQMLGNRAGTCSGTDLAMPPTRERLARTPLPLHPPAFKNQPPAVGETHDPPDRSGAKRDPDSVRDKPGNDNGYPQAGSLCERLESICTGENRPTVHIEAIQVLAWADGKIDRTVVDEAVGALARLATPPALPRAIVPLIERRAATAGVTLPPFVPVGRPIP